MKQFFITSLMLLIFVYCTGQVQQSTSPRMTAAMTEIMDPEVKIIQPGAVNSDPPSDAIILFNGTSDINKEWEGVDGNPAKWIVKDGFLICVKGSGSIKTKLKFNDFQLHIEWRSADPPTGNGQGRGNSGIYLQERYEIQVLDSYNNRTYRAGQAGAVYKQYAPLVNASRKPGEWQTFDIYYTAPRFASDSITYFTPPLVTIVHNGILIQNNVSLRGPTKNVGIPEYLIKKHGPGSLILQDHNNPVPVAYRNIWIREL